MYLFSLSHLVAAVTWISFVYFLFIFVVVVVVVFFLELGLNDMSTLLGHFVSSPRENEKRDRRDGRGDEREGKGKKEERETGIKVKKQKKIKTFPATRIAGLAQL